MTNKEKYDEIFMNSFSLDKDKLNENLVYNGVPEWDSIGHMTLIATLEEEFNIMLDTEDIIDFSSYTKGLEILAKYEVKF